MQREKLKYFLITILFVMCCMQTDANQTGNTYPKTTEHKIQEDTLRTKAYKMRSLFENDLDTTKKSHLKMDTISFPNDSLR